MVTDGHDDMHAGELETSILLAAFPDLVRSETVGTKPTTTLTPTDATS